jgi:hypothetical protein
MKMVMLSISDWNRQQALVFQRYSSFHGVPLTLEVIALLARRFARKHAGQRKYADASTASGPRGDTTGAVHAGAMRRRRFEAPTLAGRASQFSPITMALPDELPPAIRLSDPPPSSTAGAAFAPVAPNIRCCSGREGHSEAFASGAPVPRRGDPEALTGGVRR